MSGEMDEPIKIRAHHLLCLQGYQGYGYSESFVVNLERIRDLMITSPDLEVQVVAEEDIVCSCCPFRCEAGCQKDQDSSHRIRSMDLKILEKLHLISGMKCRAQNLLKLVEATFKTYSDIQDICGHCQWEEKCLWYQKFLIKN
ncbi:MAG TPA: DUF1284 domain-containing protein [Bacillota bacterium]|nr:DUF1284 domain-containing protein [Bacillota bacterium]